MKKYYALIALSLLLCLYLYVCYRSEQTVVNVILFEILGRNFDFYAIKFHFFAYLPPWVRYSLPNGLWVFAATLLARNLYFGRLHLANLPLLYVVFLEFLQYTHYTNGTFDTVDIAISVLCFVFAYAIKCPFPPQNIIKPPFLRVFLWVGGYAIVYLAEFWC